MRLLSAVRGTRCAREPQGPSATQSWPSTGANPLSAVCSVQRAACSTGLQNRQPMRLVSTIIRLCWCGLARGDARYLLSAPVLCRTALPLTRPLPQPSACLASSLQPYQALDACRPFRQVGCVTREPGPQCRPLCFIQPCRISHLHAGLARYLESTEIARRHLQTVSEPAASAWSGSESVPTRKPADLSTATRTWSFTVWAIQAVRSNRQLAPQNGQP